MCERERGSDGLSKLGLMVDRGRGGRAFPPRRGRRPAETPNSTEPRPDLPSISSRDGTDWGRLILH